ncbi:DNA gyrase subunit A [Candidatus Curtissbacteria bacterium RBG_16_39_7]|uniref:DNA gyrase subunit A n=1 Tax=Candidatus Curtissbacteria bacterium RBG_16_39_7 TaxID=1797707 RepID=A0A1F5G4B4_9BACT|nr:MAG: DNA gyrase subunit A [Candidatus Curtissbacteria bacterium RBG_16_39_7]
MGDIGKVQPVEITEEMQRSYLDYAMSVIVARALPDVRDGLKPVQRRIIYAMNQQGMKHSARYQKCAAVVGEVLKHYHPHGDISVYDALVRMAQNFSMRYQLIDGQGNFGSVDGDSAAAMRYTECRLAQISEELLRDLEKDTVDWVDNYSATIKEPTVLPAILPNLLLNGGTGIAVGMATNIPPHNLTEVVQAITHLIENPEATVEDLMKFIKGPDFPTGAQIYDISEIVAAYATGKGKIIMRAKAEIEEQKGGKHQIVVTELPYQVNKAVLVSRIAELVKTKKLEGIADLRDESDRRGMRIVVELKRDARPQATLNNLFKHTAMQLSYPVNTVALVDGTPQTLTLKMILEEFVKHRQTVVTRRSKFELSEAKKREHVLEGLKIAVDNIDAVIETIKKSKDADEAKKNLMIKFKLTEIQATAILDMQLRRLAALERQKIEDELAMTREEIAYLEDLLAHPEKILVVIKKELATLEEKFGDDRKTRVFKQKIGEFSEEDLIANEPCIITITESGYIKRQPIGTFRVQRRGGKGVSGFTTKEEDVVSNLFSCFTHDQILFFTDKGKAYALPAYDIGEASRVSKGQAIINLIDIEQGEKVWSVLPISKASDRGQFVLMVTKNGTVKKTEVSAFSAIRRSGIIAIKLEEKDQLCWVKLTGGEDEIFLISEKGQSIRFGEKDIRPTGRATMGVRGIRLRKDDVVIGMDVLNEETKKADLLVVSENGLGKKTLISEWTKQKRGGVGIKAANITERTGDLVCAKIITKEELALVLTSQQGQVIKLPLKNVPRLSRPTQGVTLMRFSNKNDRVAAATCIKKETPEQ